LLGTCCSIRGGGGGGGGVVGRQLDAAMGLVCWW
jgi:hypothetical protein